MDYLFHKGLVNGYISNQLRNFKDDSKKQAEEYYSILNIIHSSNFKIPTADGTPVLFYETTHCYHQKP